MKATSIRWEWLSLFVGFILIAALFLPGSSWLLKEGDLALFSWLNGSLTSGSWTAKVLAFLNSRYGEWLSEGLMVGLFYQARKNWRATAFAVAFISIFALLVQMVMHQLVFGLLLDLKSYSPSLLTRVEVNIGEAWPLLGNQIYSLGPFPPSYATTLGIATLWMFREHGRRFGLYTLGVSALFIVPKLFGGVHGLSDLLFGTVGLLFLIAPLFSYIPPYHIEEETCQSSY